MSVDAKTISNSLSPAARRVLFVLFFVVTALDVLSLRKVFVALSPNHDVVEKAVFEYDAERNVVARAVPWHYPMVPHPTPFDDDVFILPPGYPILIHANDSAATRFTVRIFEDPAVFLLMLRDTGSSSFEYPVLDESGAPGWREVGKTAPPYQASVALTSCFDRLAEPGAEREPDSTRGPIVEIDQRGGAFTMSLGRCRWVRQVRASDVVLTTQATARLDLVDGAPFGSRHVRYVWLILFVALSIWSRFLLRDHRLFMTDVMTTVFILLVSFISPTFLVLWTGRTLIGSLVTTGFVVTKAVRFRTGRIGIVVVLAIAGAAALLVDPGAIAAHYTEKNADEQVTAMGFDDDRAEKTWPESTSHVVLGYSTVNAAAAGRGAYGSAALDRLLQKTCGAGKTFGREGVDGANICLMASSWNARTSSDGVVKERIFVGGFNDDVAPSLKTFLRSFLPSLIASVPSGDPYASIEKGWTLSMQSNLHGARKAEQLDCVETFLRDGGSSHVTFVYDVAVFDMGRGRGYGRDMWERERRALVEEYRGTFLDMRSFFQGESLAYFNDFIHPSEIGYEAVALGLCASLDRGATPSAPPITGSSNDIP